MPLWLAEQPIRRWALWHQAESVKTLLDRLKFNGSKKHQKKTEKDIWWSGVKIIFVSAGICARQSCLGRVVFWDKKSTEARSTTKMWEGSRWGCLWWIFPLATWQGEDKALIMNCDTLMSLSGSDNTWSALYHSTFDTNEGNCWKIRPPCHGQK